MTAEGDLCLTTVHSTIQYKGMLLIGLGEPGEAPKEHLHWIKTEDLKPKPGDALLILRSEHFCPSAVLAVSLVTSFTHQEWESYKKTPEKLVSFPGYPEEITLEDIKQKGILDQRH